VNIHAAVRWKVEHLDWKDLTERDHNADVEWTVRLKVSAK
jgi:hypothetical protein